MMVGTEAFGQNRKVAVYALTRSFWLRYTCVIILPILLLLSGCTAPVRAPVVSREAHPVSRPTVRPSTYRVQHGDTLYSIAWRFGIDYASIARWNGVRYPYTIYPGQRLSLRPITKTRRSPPQTAASTKTPKTQGATATHKSVVSDKRVSGAATKSVISKSANGKKTTDSLKLLWLWPTKGSLAERFVKGDPVRKGVKINGRYGAPVKAAESGKVVYAGNGLIGYGRLVIIKHNKNYLSAYGYNRKIHVKEGDTVEKGMRIAEMGSDGNGKPMLHFEIRRNGAPIDPLKLLPRHP
jgi:lipoprotein NlpD